MARRATPWPLLLLGCAIGCPTSGGAPAARIPAATHASTLDRALPGLAASGGPGDLLLERDRLRVVVAASQATPRARLLRGSIVDAVVGEWEADALRQLTPVVFRGGVELKAAVVRVEPIGSPARGARIVQRVADPPLAMVTEVELRDPGPHVRIDTTVQSEGEVTSLRLGDRVRIHGPNPFVPGSGLVQRPWTEGRAPWIGHLGRSLSYALAFASGSASLSATFERDAAGELLALDDPRTLTAGRALHWRRSLWIAPGGLELLAGEAWAAAGVDTVEASIQVSRADERAWVSAETPRGSMLSARLSHEGRVQLPLPVGRYRLVLHAPGGSDEHTLVVSDDEARLDGELIAPVASHASLRVSDAEGRPLPARLTFRGVGQTPDPDFGSLELASGTRNVAYTASGSLELDVPPGRYELLATHGPEYTLARQELELTAERGAILRPRLTRVVDTGEWIACDLHLHAAPSHDSRVPIPDRLTALVAEGIAFAAATDHNHVTDYGPSIAALQPALAIVSTAGVEITTQSWGHFNAYPYPVDQPPPAWVDTLPRAIFDHVHQTAPHALIQVNHPRMGDMGYFNRTEFDTQTARATKPEFAADFDAIELFNGLELSDMGRVEAMMGEWFALLEQGRRYTAVGSSDSHRIIQQWAGYPRTYVRVVPAEPSGPLDAAVADALRAGRAMVSNGPFLTLTVNGAGPGATVQAPQRSVDVDVAVHAPAWIAVDELVLVVSGQPRTLTASAGEGSLRLHYQGRIELERDGWMVALTRGRQHLDAVLPGSGATPLAFTNPVWIDVDGGGVSRAPASDAAGAGQPPANRP